MLGLMGCPRSVVADDYMMIDLDLSLRRRKAAVR